MELSDHAIMCDSEQLEEWRAEINLLKPRKRKNWKGSLQDKWNVKSKVIYKIEEDKFYNWSMIYHRWLGVETYLDMLEATTSDECSVTHTSPMMNAFYLCVAGVEEEVGHPMNNVQKSELLKKVILAWAERMKTGNHVPMADRASSNRRRYAEPCRR